MAASVAAFGLCGSSQDVVGTEAKSSLFVCLLSKRKKRHGTVCERSGADEAWPLPPASGGRGGVTVVKTLNKNKVEHGTRPFTVTSPEHKSRDTLEHWSRQRNKKNNDDDDDNKRTNTLNT